MKISKSLLQAIMVGASIGAATSSCSIFEDSIEIHEDPCEEVCNTDGIDDRQDDGTYECNCPACGLG